MFTGNFQNDDFKALTLDEVIKIHTYILKRYGGLQGIRYESLLDGALNSALASFADRDFYPAALEKIAKICCAIVHHHAFADVNKRTGIAVLEVLLIINGFNLTCSNADLLNTAVALADNKLDFEGLASFLRANTEVIF